MSSASTSIQSRLGLACSLYPSASVAASVVVLASFKLASWDARCAVHVTHQQCANDEIVYYWRRISAFQDAKCFPAARLAALVISVRPSDDAAPSLHRGGSSADTRSASHSPTHLTDPPAANCLLSSSTHPPRERAANTAAARSLPSTAVPASRLLFLSRLACLLASVMASRSSRLTSSLQGQNSRPRQHMCTCGQTTTLCSARDKNRPLTRSFSCE
jgi:hypothetical protein